MEKLELQVYASNVAARRLYERFGFVVEGTRVRARKLDGKYDDVILMGLFLTANSEADSRRSSARRLTRTSALSRKHDAKGGLFDDRAHRRSTAHFPRRFRRRR